MASVVAQIKGAEIRVLDEIVLSRASTQEACDEFSRRFQPESLAIYCDATGARMQTSGTSDVKILRAHFGGSAKFRVAASNPAVRDRVQLMNAKLCSAAGERNLKVDRKCKELIKDFEQVIYKENSLVIDKDRDLKRTHLSDALGYLVWQECSAAGRVGERSERLVWA